MPNLTFTLSTAWRRLAAAQRRTLAVVGAMLLAVLVRAPFFRWPLIADEGVYAYTAHWWSRGYTLYSAELWMDRPQAIFIAYRLGMGLLGGSTAALRLWGALWVAATVPFVYLIARRLFSERAAWLAMGLYAAYSMSPHIEGFTANAELFMLLPATASLWLLLHGRPGWAGLLAGLATMLKPSGVSAGLLAVAVLWREHARWGAYARYLAAALLIPLVSLIHGLITVGWADYAYALFFSRLSIERPWPLAMFLSNLGLTAPVWLPLVVVGLLGRTLLPRSSRRFLALWLLTALPGMAMGGGWYRHYFAQLMPPLAVLAGASLAALYAAGSRQRQVWATALLCTLALSAGPYMLMPPRRGAEAVFQKPMVTYANEVSAWVRAHSTPDDTIYVAYEGAQICYLSGRRSANPYLFAIHVNYLPGVYDGLVAQIEAEEPRYVLTTIWRGALSDPDERFTLALHEHYTLVETIDLVEIYARNAEADALLAP